MNRSEYMSRLKAALADLPEKEREDALRFYNDYLDEGGVEKEEENLRSLGSPEELAKEIRNGVKGEKATQNSGADQNVQNRQYHQNNAGGKKQMDTATIILIVVLAIFALPIILPLFISFLGVMFSILVSIVAVAFSVVVAGVALGVAGVFLFGIGIWALFIVPPVGLILMGVGLLLFAIGLLFTVLCIILCRVVIPPFARWICDVTKKFIHWISEKFSGKKVQES